MKFKSPRVLGAELCPKPHEFMWAGPSPLCDGICRWKQCGKCSGVRMAVPPIGLSFSCLRLGWPALLELPEGGCGWAAWLWTGAAVCEWVRHGEIERFQDISCASGTAPWDTLPLLLPVWRPTGPHVTVGKSHRTVQSMACSPWSLRLSPGGMPAICR